VLVEPAFSSRCLKKVVLASVMRAVLLDRCRVEVSVDRV
jgi:hypothetical protein